jgi:hypothetical protein
MKIKVVLLGMKYVFASLIVLALIPVSVFAASLAPSVMEISAQRGQTVERTLTVINTSAIEQMYFLGVMKFEPQEEGGSPSFIPYIQDHSGLPEWIVFPFSEFRVPANAKGEVPFQIVVPNDVKSGGYYAAITVSQAPSDLVENNGAIVEAKTAALLLVRVEGETREKLELLDFAEAGKLTGPYTFRLQNQGNVHVTPVGKIDVVDVFGRMVVSLDANPEQGRVLPASTRRYEAGRQSANGFLNVLKEQMQMFAIGPMTAQLQLTYGMENTRIVTKSSFWYFPWQLILSAAVLFVLLSRFFAKRK